MGENSVECDLMQLESGLKLQQLRRSGWKTELDRLMCSRSGYTDECNQGQYTGDPFDGDEELEKMEKWIQCANSKKDGLYSDECSKLAPA